MGNILKCFLSCFEGEDDGDHYLDYRPTTRVVHYQSQHYDQLAASVPGPRASRPWPPPPLGPHGHGSSRPATVGIAAPAYDFLKLNLGSTSTVREGPRQHSTSLRKAQVERCIDDDGSGESYCHQAPRQQYQPGVPVPASRTQKPPRASHGVAAMERDLLNFKATSMVPEGLGQHVASSKKAQVQWYKNMLDAYKDKKPPPRTSADAAMLVATALSGIKRANLEGVFAFYGFPIQTISTAASSESHPSSTPEGVQFVLNTLPVDKKRIVDGDGFTAYVDTVDPRELADVPLEVREDFNAWAKTRDPRKRKKANAHALQTRLQNAGYKIVVTPGGEILARKYEIRLRGIDAPEMQMVYGKESQNALVKHIARKNVTLHVYGQDQFKRYVCDVYCDGVFIQKQMLLDGHVWHFKTYDKRPEFAKWEKKAQAARRGLWAYDNPEKPWEWRKNKRNSARHDITIQVY